MDSSTNRFTKGTNNLFGINLPDCTKENVALNILNLINNSTLSIYHPKHLDTKHRKLIKICTFNTSNDINRHSKRSENMSRLMTKPAKWHVRPAKTQISLGIRPVWSESSLSAWRKLESLATHWAHSEDSDQTGRMPRLIGVFAGRTVILLVFSWGGSILSVYSIKLNDFWANLMHRADFVSATGLEFLSWMFSLIFRARIFIIFTDWRQDKEHRHEKTCLRGLRPG